MISLGIWIAICFGGAAISGMVTAPAVAAWYPSLQQPSWTPPSFVFGPVWGVLYLMIAIAGWLVWRKQNHRFRRGAILIFSLQLVLNFAWSFIFFGAKAIGLAVIEIGVLWTAIFLTIISFWKISRPAALLLCPYWVWVTFAVCLNFAIWQMN